MSSGKNSLHSLQARLGSGLLISLIAVFTGLWFLISFSVEDLAEGYIASRLRHDAEMLLASLNLDQQGRFALDDKAINPVYKQPYSGHYYLIVSEGQSLSSRSLWDQQLRQGAVRPGQQHHGYQDGPNAQRLLTIDNGFVKQGRSLSITVAEDLNPIQQNIRRFQTHFSIAAGALLLLLVILQAFILRHSLGSLGAIRNEIAALQQGETQQLSTDVPSELLPLVEEINRLLGMMNQRLHRSRHALGDLAHSIKRPLTVLQQQLNRHRAELNSELYDSLYQQVGDIDQLTDRILKRARLAGQSHSGARFSFRTDLTDLLHTLRQMYQEKALDIKIVTNNIAQCPVEREDMLELLGNILDNACKWARQHVRLTVSKGHAQLRLCIEDDGVGAAEAELARLDRRGVRLDESTQGHGFGLAIATDIVQEYGGEIALGRSERLGGFRVEILLPTDGVTVRDTA